MRWTFVKQSYKMLDRNYSKTIIMGDTELSDSVCRIVVCPYIWLLKGMDFEHHFKQNRHICIPKVPSKPDQLVQNSI